MLSKKGFQTISRGRAEAARRAHNPEVGGSNPPPATTLMFLAEYTSSVYSAPSPIKKEGAMAWKIECVSYEGAVYQPHNVGILNSGPEAMAAAKKEYMNQRERRLDSPCDKINIVTPDGTRIPFPATH